MRVPFRSLLHKGRVPIGGFFQLDSEGLLEIMAYAGFEFFIIDNEHARNNSYNDYNLIRTCDSLGVPALVRVSDINEAEIKKALDGGASGLMVPNVHTLEDAKRVVAYSKFAPIGRRGACPGVRANQYGVLSSDMDAYCKRSNEENYIILSIEGPEAVRDMEQLLLLPGVDAVSVGSFDLSVSLGIPGQVKHPAIREAQQKMIDLCKKHEKDLVAFGVDAEDSRKWMEQDPTFVIHNGDIPLLKEAFCKEIAKVRGT